MYKTLEAVLNVIELKKPMAVVDMFIESYLQGIQYSKWAEGKDLTETDENGFLVNVYEPAVVDVEAFKASIKLEKKYGKDYNGHMIPFMNEDAVALLQVKALFDMGGTHTNIEFSNGTVMPMTATDFVAFAEWFVVNRNAYFV